MAKVDELSSVVPAPAPASDAFADEPREVRVRLESLVHAYQQKETVYVTQPTLPPLDLYKQKLEGVWQRRWLTNEGACHQELEQRLASHLGVEHLCLVSSCTMGLMLSMQVLGIRNCDVITTPFTFLATSNVLQWVGARPIFCDIEPETGAIDASKIEAMITPRTRAILGVHIYGHPCDVDTIEEVAERNGLAVIYDAAHAFGAHYRGRSLCGYGDLSALSFHATKLYSTCEGGAVVCKTAEQAVRLRQLRNFGIIDEIRAIAPGINGKMSELNAAYGLLQLDMVDNEIAARGKRAEAYEEALKDIPGLRPLGGRPGATHNHAYFPVLITPEYGIDRDRVQTLLNQCRIGTRKYFHPLVSHHPWFQMLPSARPESLPCAERMAEQVLCLPLYSSLRMEVVKTIGILLRSLPHVLED